MLGEKPRSSPVQESSFLEYTGPEGKKWRVECWPDLKRTFELGCGDDMVTLHERLCPEERSWRMVRLLFGVALLVGDSDLEYLSIHSHSEVAEIMGIDPKSLDAEILSAKTFWKKSITLARSPGGGASVVIPNRDALPAGDDATKLLQAHGFGDLTEELEKSYALERIMDLSAELEESKGRPLAQRAIRMELQQHGLDTMMRDLMSEYRKSDQKNKSSIRKEIESLSKTQQAIQGEYSDLMEQLNLTQSQNPSIRRRSKIEASLSGLVAAIREYESRGDRELADGVFTASEIELLLKPTTLRPPQYRPDLVILIRDAMREENLFNPNYEPPEMPRATYRRFRGALMKALQAVEEGEAIMDLEEDADDERGESSQMDDGSTVSAARIPAPPPQQSPTQPMSRATPAGDDFLTM